MRKSPPESNGKGLLICYGSNTGSCQTLAHALSREANLHGFRPTVKTLDEAMHHISIEKPVVIITASYEGGPPDNAVKFVKWLECLTDSPFSDGRHAVYGCGHRDWVDTYQRIPALIDDAFTRCGSTPLVPRGISDAANNNIFNEFDKWADNLLWPALNEQYQTKYRTTAVGDTLLQTIQSTRTTKLFQDSDQAIVQEAKVLTMPNEPQKRHLKIQLPPGMAYTAGDRLEILPINQDAMVKKIMTRFGLPLDSTIVSGTGYGQSVYTFLRDYVELNRVATEKESLLTLIQSFIANRILRIFTKFYNIFRKKIKKRRLRHFQQAWWETSR